MRRLVVCCDRTWQSAYFQPDSRALTNVARLFTAIDRQDPRRPDVQQVKLYVSGLGTGQELVVGVVAGAFGNGILEKVRETYYWLCQNYEPGDEVHLYGFSRGAYLARLVSSIISLFGFLRPASTLELLPTVFPLLCSHRDLSSKQGRRRHDELFRYIDQFDVDRKRQKRAKAGGYLVDVLGLFDTVPLLHGHTLEHDDAIVHATRNPFSLSDSVLEPEIESTYHALSIHEDRPAYSPVIYEKAKAGTTSIGGANDQELVQVWFPGRHNDIGGETPHHDLSDLTLTWLVAHVKDRIALNLEYIDALSNDATASWGAMKPAHELGRSILPHLRHFPLGSSPSSTNQYLHPSLLYQAPLDVPAPLRPLVEELSDHNVFCRLLPFEQKRKDTWPVRAEASSLRTTSTRSTRTRDEVQPLRLSPQMAPLASPREVRMKPTVFTSDPRGYEDLHSDSEPESWGNEDSATIGSSRTRQVAHDTASPHTTRTTTMERSVGRSMRHRGRYRSVDPASSGEGSSDDEDAAPAPARAISASRPPMDYRLIPPGRRTPSQSWSRTLLHDIEQDSRDFHEKLVAAGDSPHLGRSR
ncbi:hypothetical protein JCM10212_002890 [Sporobolomyces blumeae]